MNKQELLNKINESAYQVKEVRNSLFHGKCYVVATTYINGIFKTKRGAEGYIKRNSGKSYYDEYSQELVYSSAGECYEVLESEIIEVANNKMFWYKQLRKENYNIQCGLGENLIYEAKQSNVSEEIMNYIKESIKSLENNQGLTVYEEVEIKTAIEESKEIKDIEEPQQQIENTTEITQNNNTTDFTVVKDVHTKTGATIFVAKLINKIEYAEFKNIELKIKSIGGYYSRFKKGFIFSEEPTKLLQKEFNNIVNETIEQTEQVKEVQKIEQPQIVINEDLARISKQNMSFNDYKEGSATAEYNQVIEEVSKEIEEAKTKVSADSQIKLDNLLNWYKRAYATWTNKHNANGASHVSQMISGAGNYNMNKHNKFVSKEGKLWEEYNDIKDISSKIDKIINGDKIIKSSDPKALEKLKEKLRLAEEEHKGYKDYNIKARKEGKEKLSSYVLKNSNARIKVIKDRIKRIERVAV
jgi:hypothetical protein